MTLQRTKTIEIFCSYAKEDEKLFNRLVVPLQLWKRRGIIVDWHRSKVPLREKQVVEIDPNLQTANIILLFITVDWANTDSNYNEFLYAMERYQAGKARIIPIILRPSLWEGSLVKGGTYLHDLYVLPLDGKPVTTWINREDAFSDIIKGIQIVIKELSE